MTLDEDPCISKELGEVPGKSGCGIPGPADETMRSMTLHANAPLDYVEVGGTAIPRKTVPQCRTCQLGDDRDRIDAWLLQGRTPWAIVQMLAPIEISKENIREHYARGHVAIPVELAQARVGAATPPTLVQAMESIVEPLAGHLALLDAVVRDVTKRVDGGELKPTVADGIKAAEALGRAEESKDRHFEEADWEIACNALCDAARELLTFEQWGEFQQAVARNPVLQAVLAKERAQRRAVAAVS